MMFIAGRSFTEPPGFAHSALAQNSTSGYSVRTFFKRSKGVFPIKVRTVGGPRHSSELTATVALAFRGMRKVHFIVGFESIVRAGPVPPDGGGLSRPHMST